MPFEIKNTDFSGVKIITPQIFKDNRGFFLEIFKESEMNKIGINEKFVQDNVSSSSINTIRGMHFQNGKFAQGKLVSVIKGKILDVIVDLFEESSTFGEYRIFELDSIKREMLYIPPGYAHGFRAIDENTLVLYKCTHEYSKGNEGGIHPFDEKLNIDWGIKKEQAIVSEKDKALPSFVEAIKIFS